jgi:anti-anti-sigma regulatory factor
MSHKISIVVRADVDRESLGLFVGGCLTSATAPILSRHIHRARALGPAAPILIDLTECRHIDSGALEALRAVVDVHAVQGGPEPSLRLEVPEPLPVCPLSEELPGDPAEPGLGEPVPA